MKKLMMVWLALAGVVRFSHAMDYSDDNVRQLILTRNWESVAYQVGAGRISPQQLTQASNLNLNQPDTKGRPLVYHLVRALAQSYQYMGFSQALIDNPNIGNSYNKTEIEPNRSIAIHSLTALVNLLKINALDTNYWFVTSEDDVGRQIQYSALYQMIIQQNKMNALEAVQQRSLFNQKYAQLQLHATIALCIMGGCLALVGLTWYYHQPEEDAETDATAEIKS